MTKRKYIALLNFEGVTVKTMELNSVPTHIHVETFAISKTADITEQPKVVSLVFEYRKRVANMLEYDFIGVNC